MSPERALIIEMIETREALIVSGHRHADWIAKEEPTVASARKIQMVHAEISKFYDEILLLKTVLLATENS